MDDTERVEMMIKLSTVDEEWADRPQAAVRRLVEIRWLMDWIPPTSAIVTMMRDDPLISIDDLPRVAHMAGITQSAGPTCCWDLLFQGELS
jgi:phosphatidylserine/phosphatidylglycerophosphate/cardiolipin synthase-like enzyme